MESPTKITVEAIVNAPVEKVWEYWSNPEHIVKWAFASDGWFAPNAENDLKVDGKFTTTMAAKDGSFSFDFGGVYTKVEEFSQIEYIMGDGRTAGITFTDIGNATRVVETFDAENTNPIEMQKGGWQAILENFKKYAENS